METQPDSLSDMEDWPLGFWVAGSQGGHPVVYDFDNGGGDALPMPDTTLDPENPVTYIAQVPIADPLVIATQSTEGPTVWVRSQQSWTRIFGPEGALQDALVIEGVVYLVIDGDLWRRPLS